MEMTKSQKRKCHAIIHAASVSTGVVGAGLAQLPCSDNVVITPIQTIMVIRLGRVFGKALTESAAKTVLAVTTAKVGRAASQVAIGWIPGYGNAINACTAVALTEGLGWLVAAEFNKEAAA